MPKFIPNTCPENFKKKTQIRNDAVFVCEDLEGAWFSAQRKPLREDQDHESLREIEAGES